MMKGLTRHTKKLRQHPQGSGKSWKDLHGKVIWQDLGSRMIAFSDLVGGV